MRIFRFFLFVAVIPLLFLWGLTKFLEPVLKERSGVAEDEQRARLQAEADRQSIYGPNGPPKPAAAPPPASIADQVEAEIAKRRALAIDCLTQARRATRAEIWDARALLVVVTFADCRADCQTAQAATTMSEQYRIDGLRLLMIDTADNDSAGSAPGMETVVLPQCRPLVSERGDDYFVRAADGAISSSGERHEAALRQRLVPDANKSKAAAEFPPFAPDALVRRSLGL